MKLQKLSLPLIANQTAWLEYDQDSDLLELFFQSAEATCAIELTESIILRFDWDNCEPLSLSFISMSKLVQPSKFGPVHFQLLNEEWPDEVQDKVWSMLQRGPLNEVLTLSSYVPAHSHQVIPMAAIKQPRLALGFTPWAKAA